MNLDIKEKFRQSITYGTADNVRDTFFKYSFIQDDSYFDYDLLKVALIRGQEDIVDILLEAQFRVRNPNKIFAEDTPLHLAIKLEKTKIIEKILERGGSIYAKNGDGKTPIYAAFSAGYRNGVNAALNIYLKDDSELSFDFHVPDPKNKDDVDNFQIACILNNLNVVEYYLKAGFDVNAPFGLEYELSDIKNPMHYAIDKNFENLLHLILRYGGDLSLANVNGLTPLRYMYYSGRSGKYKIKQCFQYGNHTKFCNDADINGVSNFLICCTINYPEIIQAFIDLGVDVNSAISSNSSMHPGFTALHLAITYKCVEVVELLLRNGADSTKVNINGSTPLHLACEETGFNNRLIIQILLNYKADPTALDNNSFTPLHIAFCKVDHVSSFIIDKLILASPPNINRISNQGLSYFHIFCTRNDTSRVMDFIKSGIDVNSCLTSGFYRGYTALHFAVLCNQKFIVEMLLKNGANVNAQTGEDLLTPLHMACNDYVKYRVSHFRNSSVSNFLAIRYDTFEIDIVKLLLDYGADVNAIDHLGQTPLLRSYPKNRNCFNVGFMLFSGETFLEYSNRQKEIIELLLSYNADINAQSHSKETILHICTKHDHLYSLEHLQEYLINKGADINAADADGLTPLHVAVKSKNCSAVEIFLKNQANVNAKTNDLLTPLQIAIQQYRETDDVEEIICQLLEYGSDLNVRDSNGKTTLHSAIEERQVYVVEKLLDYGADINVSDFAGNSCVSSLLVWDVEAIDSMRHDDIACYRVFEVIITHIKRLLALGRYVNAKVLEICNSLFERYQKVIEEPDEVYRYGFKSFRNTFDNCVKELDTLKLVRLNSYISLYDILLLDSHELSLRLEYDKLVEILDNINISYFPLFFPLLQASYKKALVRYKFLESADIFLRYAAITNLPEPCWDRILGDLNNEDIVNLKAACPLPEYNKEEKFRSSKTKHNSNKTKDDSNETKDDSNGT